MASSTKLLIKTIIIAGMFFCFESFATAECVGVVTAGGGQGFWGDVIKGANHAGKELGIEIKKPFLLEKIGLAVKEELDKQV